jgi:hypothetical protein
VLGGDRRRGVFGRPIALYHRRGREGFSSPYYYDPDVLHQAIVEDLKAALGQFRESATIRTTSDQSLTEG